MMNLKGIISFTAVVVLWANMVIYWAFYMKQAPSRSMGLSVTAIKLSPNNRPGNWRYLVYFNGTELKMQESQAQCHYTMFYLSKQGGNGNEDCHQRETCMVYGTDKTY